MPDSPPPGYRLMIVDDDAMTREMLMLLAQDAGFFVEESESGLHALETLGLAGANLPQAILVDLQMPGPSGETLARLLRVACGPETILIAMSGTAAGVEQTRGYDAFLLKPFAIDDLSAVLHGARLVPGVPAPRCTLNETTFQALLQTLSVDQVRQLYTMCLDDVDRRIGTMRQAAAERDDDAYRRVAHSIKGGCGMVGASELAGLADAMEAEGLPAVDEETSFQEFLSASLELRRMLDARLT